MPTISFIIPVYNAEKYIARCLRSILTQNLASDTFEVIVVNDGSTDNSLKVIEGLKSEFPNILIINQKNQGVSVARNEGLQQAKGKYIYFVDADDFLTSNSIMEIIVAIEKTDAEAIGFSFNHIKNEDIRFFSRGKDLTKPIKGIDWARLYIKELYYTPTFIFNRQKLIEKKIKFNHKVTVWEDVLFLTQFFCLAKSVHFLDRPVYNYVLYPDSSSQKRVFRTPANRFFIFLSLVKFYLTRKLNKKQSQYIRNRIKLWAVLLTDTLTRYVFIKWLTRAKDEINARV
jgi:glycosyltransferase involved in cell wall biosynthesis